jgi:3',5'-cyclic-AMP phosphodiesterase
MPMKEETEEQQRARLDLAANPDALGTLREAIAKIKALPVKPAFMIHTGDISHLSKDAEFDHADQVIREAGLPVF